jgi:hypothetical protein
MSEYFTAAYWHDKAEGARVPAELMPGEDIRQAMLEGCRRRTRAVIDNIAKNPMPPNWWRKVLYSSRLGSGEVPPRKGRLFLEWLALVSVDIGTIAATT